MFCNLGWVSHHLSWKEAVISWPCLKNLFWNGWKGVFHVPITSVEHKILKFKSSSEACRWTMSHITTFILPSWTERFATRSSREKIYCEKSELFKTPHYYFSEYNFARYGLNWLKTFYRTGKLSGITLEVTAAREQILILRKLRKKLLRRDYSHFNASGVWTSISQAIWLLPWICFM